METRVYEKIVHTIKSNPNLSRDEVFSELSQQFGITQQRENRPITLNEPQKDFGLCDSLDISKISYSAFVSIYSNIKRRQMFKTSMWRKFKENSADFSQKYLELDAKEEKTKRFKSLKEKLDNNILLKMAKEANVPPVLMARLVIEGFFKKNSLEYEFGSDNEAEKVTVSTIIRETHLLKNARLACELMECCALDEDYGPVIDAIKNVSGNEYEIKMERILREKGIQFIKESELREKGYDKTPDFKFESPVYLKSSGKIISWVDSKATFGDEISHAEYYETQYKFYLNRFGSGLVIYWLGYVKDIENCYNSLSYRSVIVSDHFPDEFVKLELNSLIQKNLSF